MWRALRAESADHAGKLAERIARLEEERLYSRPGWRVAERHATLMNGNTPNDIPPRRSWFTLFQEWLMHPLIRV